MNAPLTGPGNLIKGRWKILKKIGQGAFGEVYSARNVVTSELVAIKVERVDSTKQVLKLEVAVLKKLQAANCPYAVSFITCGRHNEYNYMVMELLGDNISELRRSQPNGKFSMLTTLKLGIQMLRAIEAVHDLGYLHRDVKPSNYAMGLAPSKRHSCYLIDFGLARRYVMPNGEVRPGMGQPRGQTGFRGTARYASINSHQSKDLSRRDDLWSLLYVLIEFAKGKLPWRRTKDKDEVGEMKMKMNNQQLVADLPQEFNVFMEHLLTLRYVDRPNYSFLHKTLNDLFYRLGGDENTPFDWERERVAGPRRPRPISRLSDLCFLQVAQHIQRYDVVNLEPALQQRLVEFLIRSHEGRWEDAALDKVLQPSMDALDLQLCTLTEEQCHTLTSTCPNLQQLSLGALNDHMLKEILGTYGSRLEHFSLQGDRVLSTKAYKLLGDSCTALTSLRIQDEKFSDKALEHILRHCNALTSLDVSGCRKVHGTAFKPFESKKRTLRLTTLNLSDCELGRRGFKALSRVAEPLDTLIFSPLVATFKISSGDFVGLLQACPHLTHLELTNHQFEMDTVLGEIARECPQLTAILVDGISMTDQSLEALVKGCTNLRKLRFRYGDGVTDASLTQIAHHCTLDSLTMDFWNRFNRLSVSDHGIKTLLQSCSQLKELSLCSCLILTGACFPETVYFSSLHTLNLSDCIQLNDFAIRRITESCPHLRSLSLSNINNLSSVSLEAIGIACPHLEELNLQQCTCFSDEAMIDLLQGMPRLFMSVTRFTSADLHGLNKEVHCTNVTSIFNEFPNTYRERAFDRTRRRMYGMGP